MPKYCMRRVGSKGKFFKPFVRQGFYGLAYEKKRKEVEMGRGK